MDRDEVKRRIVAKYAAPREKEIRAEAMREVANWLEGVYTPFTFIPGATYDLSGMPEKQCCRETLNGLQEEYRKVCEAWREHVIGLIRDKARDENK